MQHPAPPAAPGHPAPGRPVFARHAASLLVLRDGPGGTEVLMGMRGAGHRFMPNRLVFPGGAVDPEDAALPAAAEPRPEVLAMLARGARPRLARALVAAAARELQEETGLTLGMPPQLDGVDYLCRAITPPSLPIRFNARFLVVDASYVSGTLAGSGELEGLGYLRVAEAVALDLALVTREVLQRLQLWLALPPAARPAREKLDVFKKRQWRLE